jgi:hypothetical protein
MSLRQVLAISLSVFLLTLGVPASGDAQSQAKNGRVRGQIVDLGGRGAPGMRVELVSGRQVLAVTSSTADGYFSFASIPAGEYIVRTTLGNGQPTGVKVSVTASVPEATAFIVMPSIALAAPQVGAAAAVVTQTVLTIGTTAVVVTVTTIGSAIYVEAQSEADQEVLVQAQAAATTYLVQLGNQTGTITTGTGTSGNPFVFIPTVPQSG